MQNLGLCAVVGPYDGDNVEAAGNLRLEQSIATQKAVGGPGQSLLFFRRHGFSRLTTSSGLYFNKHERVTVSGDNVEFAATRAEAAAENAHSLPSEMPRRFTFAAPT
jgi:hypothetical protein